MTMLRRFAVETDDADVERLVVVEQMRTSVFSVAGCPSVGSACTKSSMRRRVLPHALVEHAVDDRHFGRARGRRTARRRGGLNRGGVGWAATVAATPSASAAIAERRTVLTRTFRNRNEKRRRRSRNQKKNGNRIAKSTKKLEAGAGPASSVGRGRVEGSVAGRRRPDHAHVLARHRSRCPSPRTSARGGPGRFPSCRGCPSSRSRCCGAIELARVAAALAEVVRHLQRLTVDDVDLLVAAVGHEDVLLLRVLREGDVPHRTVASESFSILTLLHELAFLREHLHAVVDAVADVHEVVAESSAQCTGLRNCCASGAVGL